MVLDQGNEGCISFVIVKKPAGRFGDEVDECDNQERGDGLDNHWNSLGLVGL
jgi:hypothetical protein